MRYILKDISLYDVVTDMIWLRQIRWYDM